MPAQSILIVDDHAAFRAIARDLLQANGFEVVGEAADGQQAIAETVRLRPEVVLLDVRLADLDGFEVTRRLLRCERPPAVVLVSTMDSADLGRRIETSGARGFITKSRLSGDTLRALLEEGRA
jgi:DNA-binding NarL/FixJ family response regulator